MGVEISFIIPCYNEQEWLPRLLASLDSCTVNFDAVECIVVDNASTDRTVEVLWELAPTFKYKVRLVHEPRKGVSLARNSGGYVAKGKILAFLDADNLLTQKFLDRLFQVHRIPNFSGATIRTLAEPGSLKGSILFYLLEAIKILSPKPFGKSVVTKEAFALAGGFDSQVKLGENVIFTSLVKKIAKRHNKRFLHISSPIYCSLRRFEKIGYMPILGPWALAYLGSRHLDYSTIDEI